MSKPISNGDIPALPPGVTLTTLENGLVIIVREDHSAPVVSAQAWAMAGSIHEGKWLGAGMSHVLEHMLFKGTTSRPGSRIDQEVQEAGGYMNVYDPGRRASRRLFETAYTRSPYRFTIIGYPDIFHELKPEDILAYYQEKYAPNNIFYVVAGDVKHDEVLAQ